MRVLVALLALALCFSIPDTAPARSNNGISAGVPDPRILNLHAKADDLFERGEVGRAFFIYRNELVPLGDKYAQYMVGYMHLTGLATRQDRVAASAWYRLAAERGTPEFVALRDRLLAELTDEQRQGSDSLYRELHLEYCDLVILLTSIKRLHSAAAAARERAPNDSDRANEYDQVHRELTRQLQTLKKLGGFRGMETNPARIRIEDIERLVTRRIAETID